MTWGDFFRLFKYYLRFSEWDANIKARIFRIYPSRLNKDVIFIIKVTCSYEYCLVLKGEGYY